MSVPNVPGFIGRLSRETLSDIWQKPDAVPDGLWPKDVLEELTSTPTEWVTLTRHDTKGERWHAVACALVPAEQTEGALASWEWFRSAHGNVSVWADGRVDSGLVDMDRDLQVEFFAQGRAAVAHPPM